MSRLLLAAAAAAAVSLPAAATAAGRVVTAADNGGTVLLRKGDALTVRLSSNPSTGYSWSVAALPPLLRAGASAMEAAARTGGPQMTGAPGVQVLRFIAATPGRGGLQLVYNRSWVKPVPADAQSFQITVVVR